MKHPDILKWRTDLMERYGLSAKEANRPILDSLLVGGDVIQWADSEPMQHVLDAS